jgi:hypothetical protein
MRPLPLLPSDLDPAAWPGIRDAELRWTGVLHQGWRSRSIHALHLGAAASEGLLEEAQGALAAGLGPDFLVLPAAVPSTRQAGFAMLGLLETLLQVTHGRVKVALRLAPEAMAPMLALLREAKGDAVGFCWQPGLDPEPLADRLWCAVGSAGADLDALRRTGYRWNLALEAPDEATFRAWSADLLSRFPPVLFPAEKPATALGRPVVEDPDVSLGSSWGRPQ